MAYAQLTQIMIDTNSYIGETIKIQGIYFEDNNNDTSFSGILYIDSTNCCVGYLELILPDGVSKPELNTEIMVVGSIDLIEINGANMAALKVSDYIFS